jgi:hypothetical protein
MGWRGDVKGWLVREQKELNFLYGVGEMREVGSDMVMSVLAVEGMLSRVPAGVVVEVR